MSKKAFTLIEILVVTSIIGLVAVAASQIFLRLMVINAKSRAIADMKQQGDNALITLSQQLRRAQAVTSLCPATSNTITITDYDNHENVSLSCDENGITIEGDTIDNKVLIDYSSHDQYQLYNPNQCFKCLEDIAGGPKVVEINYTLQKNKNIPPNGFKLIFSSAVSLRTY